MLGLRAWLFPLLVGAEMLAGVVQEHGDSGVIKATRCHIVSYLASPFLSVLGSEAKRLTVLMTCDDPERGKKNHPKLCQAR